MSSGPILLLKHGHLQPVAQDCVEVFFSLSLIRKSQQSPWNTYASAQSLPQHRELLLSLLQGTGHSTDPIHRKGYSNFVSLALQHFLQRKQLYSSFLQSNTMTLPVVYWM